MEIACVHSTVGYYPGAVGGRLSGMWVPRVSLDILTWPLPSPLYLCGHLERMNNYTRCRMGDYDEVLE